jgi:hypothetical protein
VGIRKAGAKTTTTSIQKLATHQDILKLCSVIPSGDKKVSYDDLMEQIIKKSSVIPSGDKKVQKSIVS